MGILYNTRPWIRSSSGSSASTPGWGSTSGRSSARRRSRWRSRSASPATSVGRTDNIHDTVHYGEVVERIVAELAERRFKLLEALAEHMCAIITGEFKAPWVRLSVAKLGHIRNVRKVGVMLERRREPGRMRRACSSGCW